MEKKASRARREFGQNLLSHLDALYGFAFVLSKSRSETEDLIQQTYLKALEDPARFRDGSNMKAWLLTILRNLWINQQRARRVRNSFHFEEELISDLTFAPEPPDILFERNTERLLVRKAIESLPPIHREVVVLRDLQGMSYREIAEILRCPIGTVMSRLGRAHAQLRHKLRDLIPVEKPGRLS